MRKSIVKVDDKRKELLKEYEIDIEKYLVDEIENRFKSLNGSLESKKLAILENQEDIICDTAIKLYTLDKDVYYENDDLKKFDRDLDICFEKENQSYKGYKADKTKDYKYSFKDLKEIEKDLRNIFYKCYKNSMSKCVELMNLKDNLEEKGLINTICLELSDIYLDYVKRGYYSKDIVANMQKSNVRFEICNNIANNYDYDLDKVDELYSKGFKKFKDKYGYDTYNKVDNSIKVPTITKFAIGLKVARKMLKL